MKTPINEAIEYLRKFNLLSAAEIIEVKFLDIEKQSLKAAFNAGKLYAAENDVEYYGGKENINPDFEEYFNKMYKK